MNYSKAIFLINQKCRAILVDYDGEPGTKRVAFKTLDQSIQKDDYVVIETHTRHGMTVVKAVECDIDIDLDSGEEMRWIVGKVDRASHEELLKEEEKAIKTIKSAELRKKRDDLRTALFADHMATIQSLPIANTGGDE